MKEASNEIFEQVKEVKGVRYIAASLNNQSMDALRSLGDQWKTKEISNIFVVASHEGESAKLLVLVDKEANDMGIKAGDLIKPLAKVICGGGGGRPDMAQAGGKKPEAIQEMIDLVAREIEKLL